MNLETVSVVIFSLVHHLVVCGSIPPPPISELINVHKCCPERYFITHTSDCIEESVHNDTIQWKPTFSDSTGKQKLHLPYRFQTGIPTCRLREPWPVYQYDQNENPCDKLVLLADGTLRHYVLTLPNSINDSPICRDQVTEETQFQDYNVSVYCIDRVSPSCPAPHHESYGFMLSVLLQTTYEHNGRLVMTEKAMLCVPENGVPWHDTNFVMSRVVNPVFRVIAIACFLIVGVVYFVLPQLCDLTGNIITTLVVCLICEQVSDIIRIYDEYHSAMSYLLSGKPARWVRNLI